MTIVRTPAQLRRQLLAAGLSEYEPDPVSALEVVAARQRGDDRGAGKPGAWPLSRALRGDRVPAAFRQDEWEIVPALDGADVADC